MGYWLDLLAEAVCSDAEDRAIAAGLDASKVPSTWGPGLTLVLTGGRAHSGDVVNIIALGEAVTTSDYEAAAGSPIVFDAYRRDVDSDWMGRQRPCVGIAFDLSTLNRTPKLENLRSYAKTHTVTWGREAARLYLRAQYDVVDADLMEAGFGSLRWSESDDVDCGVEWFLTATYGTTLRDAVDRLRARLTGGDENLATVDRHHDHDEPPPARPMGEAAASVVRKLSEMTGFGAEATQWGMDLARDLRDYVSGEIAWADVDKGLLLSGPPGCGKTTFAKAVALECGVRFVASGYSDWEGHMTGTGYIVRAMKKRFEEWRKLVADGKGPLLVLWDELDTMGRRGQGGHNAGYWDGVVNATLDFLDGGEPREGIVVIGCTNHPDKVDEALKRPGRLDRTLVLPPPSREALRGILAAHLRVDAHAVGMDEATRAVGGRTPAEVEQAVRDARRHARRLRRAATPADVTAVVAAHDAVFPQDVTWRSTVHEAGHAVVALALGMDVVEMHRHLCVVRSVMMSTPRRLLDEICYTLAAGAAEEAVCGTVSTGRKVDLSDATHDAARYHASYGFGGTLTHAFRGEHGSSEVTLTPELAARVEATLAEQWERARDLVRGRVGRIDRLARRLAVVRHMTGDEIRECLRLDFGPLARGCDRRWEIQADDYDAVPMAA